MTPTVPIIETHDGGSWDRPSRHRTDKHPTRPKKRFELIPHPSSPASQRKEQP